MEWGDFEKNENCESVAVIEDGVNEARGNVLAFLSMVSHNFIEL